MKKDYLYSKEVMEHFFKPHNIGEIKKPSGIGKVGNLICGDTMQFYIKVKQGKITEASFQTFGCVVAIANTSLLTTMIKGKTLEEALKITKDDILEKLGHDLPPIKIHCSVLAVDALHEAMYDYFSKNNLPISKELKEEHERIVKNLQNVEKHHKEYIDFEREIHEK